MPHTLYAPEQFRLVDDSFYALPDSEAAGPDALTLQLDPVVASVIANAVHNRSNSKDGQYNNYHNIEGTPFYVDVSEVPPVARGHFPLRICTPKVPKEAGIGYRLHLPNAVPDSGMPDINTTFAYAFQRLLDLEEHTERPSSLKMLGLGTAMTVAPGMVGVVAGVEAIDLLGADPSILPIVGVGGLGVGLASAIGLCTHGIYRRHVTNREAGRINREHMKATLRHVAQLDLEPVIYTV